MLEYLACEPIAVSWLLNSAPRLAEHAAVWCSDVGSDAGERLIAFVRQFVEKVFTLPDISVDSRALIINRVMILVSTIVGRFGCDHIHVGAAGMALLIYMRDRDEISALTVSALQQAIDALPLGSK